MNLNYKNMKKETLEEAAISNYKKMYEGEPLTQDVPIDAFKRGYKLARKQMYTKKDVWNMCNELASYFIGGDTFDLKEWFKQFKKK